MSYTDSTNPGAWFSTGNPSTVDDATATAFAPGQLGSVAPSPSVINIPSGTTHLPTGGFPRLYMYVQLDAASATPAFGQFLVWKDRTSYSVTTASSNTKRGSAAGLLINNTATLGNYIWMLVSGIGAALNENATTPAAEDIVIGGATTAGRVGVMAQGTAPLVPTYGVFLGAKTVAFGGSSALPTDVCAVWVDFPRVGRL